MSAMITWDNDNKSGFKIGFTVGLYIQIFILHIVIPTNQTGRKEQKCLCVSPESRCLFEILICFVNVLDSSCKKTNMKRLHPIPPIHPCVFHSIDLSLRIINFTFALQMKRSKRVSESTAWLLFVPRTII